MAEFDEISVVNDLGETVFKVDRDGAITSDQLSGGADLPDFVTMPEDEVSGGDIYVTATDHEVNIMAYADLAEIDLSGGVDEGIIELGVEPGLTKILARAAEDQTDFLLRLDDSAGNSLLTVNAANTVTTSLDVVVTDPTRGIILTSPDLTQWRVTVSDLGVITATEV